MPKTTTEATNTAMEASDKTFRDTVGTHVSTRVRVCTNGPSFFSSVVADDVAVVPFVVAATLVPVTESAAGVFDWNAVRLIL